MVSALNATVCKVYLSVCRLRFSYTPGLNSLISRLFFPSLSYFGCENIFIYFDLCARCAGAVAMSSIAIAHLYERTCGRHMYGPCEKKNQSPVRFHFWPNNISKTRTYFSAHHILNHCDKHACTHTYIHTNVHAGRGSHMYVQHNSATLYHILVSCHSSLSKCALARNKINK